MSTQNIGFYEELTKIVFEVSSNSSNSHLISSADNRDIDSLRFRNSSR